MIPNALQPRAGDATAPVVPGSKSNQAWRLGGLIIKSLRTPIRAPSANSIAERWVRTVRRECLDHLILINERHLRRILVVFVDYYNHDRPHRSLGLQAPVPEPQSSHGGIAVRPVLGGLHHVYERAA